MASPVYRWLKHAFAVETHTGEPPPEQQEVMDRVCREVVRRGLATPALMFLEMSRPMSYMGSQTLHFFTPILSAILRGSDVGHMAAFLERRDSIPRMCQRIEGLVAEEQKRQSSSGKSSPGPSSSGPASSEK